MTLAAWNELIAQVNGRTFFGQPGVRDPDAPCDAFAPGTPEASGRCSTDGHYMCDECRLRATCAGCGQRPMQCECVGREDEPPAEVEP